MQPEGQFNLYLIPLAPLVGALINLVLGGWMMRRWKTYGRDFVHLVAITAVALSGFVAASAVFQAMVPQDLDRLVNRIYPWIVSGETHIGVDLLLDRLSAILVLVITGVGLLIHMFSVGYMARDPGYHRYFAYLNLFTAAMLILVLGKSLVLTFVGWEGVGLCSYLLIGFLV